MGIVGEAGCEWLFDTSLMVYRLAARYRVGCGR